MTFEKIYNSLVSGNISSKDAYDMISEKDKIKTINYYAHLSDISKEPLNDNQLAELNCIVRILQMLYTSNTNSPISDENYDSLQELLIDMGIPRLTGSIEINDNKKVSHRFKNLRGTLDKIYYLYPDEPRTNKSRKYLDEWIKSTEALYKKNSGKEIDLNNVKVMIQPKMDGTSVILDNGDKPLWMTRGDTRNNRASDVSHIMNIFNDIYASSEYVNSGQKFEVMMSEENKDKINSLIGDPNLRYRNSRQVVTSIINSNEADFKAEYLCPVPLRITRGDGIEEIHPKLIEEFPTKVCLLSDRDAIKKFANENKYVLKDGMRLRTDGAVITILDENIQKALGRDNDINNFEVAYKFTEEVAYSKVKDVEFYVSGFGIITPVLVVNDVILKGNTINHISLSNKERFDELNLHYGDEVKVLYDIIPYATIDEKCRRIPNGRKIRFTTECPSCHAPLELDKVQVHCTNPECPSIVVGRILNYCKTLRIDNIGYQTLDLLYVMGFLKNGIRSLYKLRKKISDIENLEGFGKLKTKKIISEIEAKRNVKDYELFGALGIEGLSTKTFQLIFNNIKLDDFINMILNKNSSLLTARLVAIKGIGNQKADLIINYFNDKKNVKELEKLLEEVKLNTSFSTSNVKRKRIVFSGCRPTNDVVTYLDEYGYDATDSYSNSAEYLIIPKDDYQSSKVGKAKANNIKIVALNGNNQLDVMRKLMEDSV